MSTPGKEAQDALDRLVALHIEEKTQKATIKRDIEREYEARLLALRLQKSVAANTALNPLTGRGASKSAIGRAIGTTNFTTVVDLLELTAGRTRSQQERQYTVDPATGKSTLNWLTTATGTRVDGPWTSTWHVDPDDGLLWPDVFLNAAGVNDMALVIQSEPTVLESIRSAFTGAPRA